MPTITEKKMSELVARYQVEKKIFLIRGQKVMIDADLNELYGTSTKALNQAVKRNPARFPGDFAFRLTVRERDELVTNCDRFKTLKHSSSMPYAFTEQGIAMLSSVLKSEKAVRVNVEIMRAFVRLREILATNKDFARRLEELERKFNAHDQQFQAVFDAIRELMKTPEKSKRRIGFTAEEKRAPWTKATSRGPGLGVPGRLHKAPALYRGAR
jgi:hypothetical protein